MRMGGYRRKDSCKTWSGDTERNELRKNREPVLSSPGVRISFLQEYMHISREFAQLHGGTRMMGDLATPQ